MFIPRTDLNKGAFTYPKFDVVKESLGEENIQQLSNASGQSIQALKHALGHTVTLTLNGEGRVYMGTVSRVKMACNDCGDIIPLPPRNPALSEVAERKYSGMHTNVVYSNYVCDKDYENTVNWFGHIELHQAEAKMWMSLNNLEVVRCYIRQSIKNKDLNMHDWDTRKIHIGNSEPALDYQKSQASSIDEGNCISFIDLQKIIQEQTSNIVAVHRGDSIPGS